MTNVAIADDSALLREGIVRLLEQSGFEVAGQAGDGEDLLRKVGAHKPDVAVIDVTAERVGTIGIGSGPAANVDALSVDPSGKRLYVAVTDAVGSRLVIVDTETSLVHRVLPIGAPIRDIAYGVTPYILVMLAFIWLLYVFPGIVTWLPQQIG